MSQSDGWSEDWIERKNGVLTERDRRYLLGEIDLQEKYENPHKQEQYIKTKIRERVKNAMLDFGLVAHHLTPRDLVLMFEEEGSESEEVDISSDLFECILGLFTLATRMSRPTGAFHELAEAGINEGLTLHESEVEDTLYTGKARLEFESALEDGELRVPLDEISDSKEDILSQVNGRFEEEMRQRVLVALSKKWAIDQFKDVMGIDTQLVGKTIPPKKAVEEVMEETFDDTS